MSAGIQDRFPEKSLKDRTDFSELGKRVVNDVVYFGHKSGEEERALNFLREKTELDFKLNSMLNYRNDVLGEFNGTPDAVLKEGDQITSVAEFKHSIGLSTDLSQLSGRDLKTFQDLERQAKKQLLINMKICCVSKGYLVLTCSTSNHRVEIIHMNDSLIADITVNKMSNFNIFRKALTNDSKSYINMVSALVAKMIPPVLFACESDSKVLCPQKFAKVER